MIGVLRAGGLLAGWRDAVVGTWEGIEREAAAERARAGVTGFDGRAGVVFVLIAAVMIFQEYGGDRPAFFALFPRYRDHPYSQLLGFGWWSAAKLVGYIGVPAVAIWLGLGGRMRDYGLSFSGLRRHLWIYVAFYLAVLPLVILASRTQAFQNTYPYYRNAPRSWWELGTWELSYGATFFALEFFFRGFCLVALRRSLGASAIFAMIVPYCMIDFHKPVAEVAGAIVAGIALGTLAMATRSIRCGVLIHVSVAWTMDVLALLQTSGFPGSGRFIGR